jgi:hypothetical protein
MYDVKKQLAAMTLTLRNVAVLDTKARFPAGIDNTPSSLLFECQFIVCASAPRPLILRPISD